MADRVAMFNDGKIVQVGSPSDIYERPQSRFVADFVGSSNVLSPAFAASHGGVGQVDEPRPEKVGVFRVRARWCLNAHAHTDGEIKVISYQGAVTRFSVEAEGLRITAEVPATRLQASREGDNVRLIWPKSAMVTMEEGA